MKTNEVGSDYSNSQILIIGAGLMGCGISQVFASLGADVFLYDPLKQALDDAKQKIRDNLLLLGQSSEALEKITLVEDFHSVGMSMNYVFEAAPEKLEIKRSIFKELIQHTNEDCILASNTSVIPIGDIAQGMHQQNRIIGTHWWNPPYLVPLVEVVQSEFSSPHFVDRMMGFLSWAGKKPIHVKKDITGFVANRMQHALWREAISLIDKGVCDAATVDTAVKNSFGMRLPILGPIENADMVGLDLTRNIHDVVLQDLCNESEPSALLDDKIMNGHLGMSTGEGLKKYSASQAKEIKKNMIDYLLRTTQSIPTPK